MQTKKPNQFFIRFFLSLLGVAFIAWGLTTVALGLFGEKEIATITGIRREMGERNEVKRGRYTYNISYTFTLPGGKNISGSSKLIGDAVFLKADGKSKTAVRYFSFFPAINALEQDTKPGFGQLILVATGCFLIYIINRRKRKTNINI